MGCRGGRGTAEPGIIGIVAVTQKKVPKGGEIGISDGDAVTAAAAFLLGDLLELSVSTMEGSGSTDSRLNRGRLCPHLLRESGVRSLWLEGGVVAGLNRRRRTFSSGSQFL